MDKKDIEAMKEWLVEHGYHAGNSDVAKSLRKLADDWDVTIGFVKILGFEYIGEVISPDNNTDVPSRHKDLYSITVSTDGDITKRNVIFEDKWFEYPPNTNVEFVVVMNKEFGNRVVNNYRAWHMYLDAFKKAHPEVEDEMIQDSLTQASADTGERCVTLKAALDWHMKQCKMCSERSKILNNVKKDVEKMKEWSNEDECLLRETIKYLEEFIRIDKKHFSGYDVPRCKRDIDWLKSLKFKMKGQQPNGKIEAKFKVGDWIVDNCGYVWKIKEILNKCCRLKDVEGREIFATIEWVDNTFHLWTITDAKDGDTLISSNKQPFMYNGNYTSNSVGAYFALTCTGEIITCGSGWYNNWTNLIGVHPATKEQRTLLFQKMEEDGWKWDAEKKELIEKIKLVSKESDCEKIRKNIIELVRQSSEVLNKQNQKDMLDWLEKQSENMLDADKVIEWLRKNICSACHFLTISPPICVVGAKG